MGNVVGTSAALCPSAPLNTRGLSRKVKQYFLVSYTMWAYVAHWKPD